MSALISDLLFVVGEVSSAEVALISALAVLTAYSDW